nr:iron ABC transporter permease [Rhodococcus kyotonensis]
MLAAFVLSAVTGAIEVSAADAGRIVIGHLVPGMTWMTDGSLTPLEDQAVWKFRLPRTLLAAVSGASLALAGALMQAVVRNPLAEPYILGVSAGAGTGAVTVVVFGLLSTVSLSIAAFAGALVATVAVVAVARDGARISPYRLILGGAALGALFSAITSYLTLTTEAQNVFTIMFFLLGSVSAATMHSLVVPMIAFVAVFALGLRYGRDLNALAAGDDLAVSLGVDVNRLRAVLLVSAALLTAAVVAVAGSIGFVGLIVPHISRMIVGVDHRRLLPFAVVLGALFLVVADLLARTVAAPAEVPIGIITSVTGAPFFLWLMRRSRVAE